MGRKSAAEAIIAIVTAFIERSSWRQAELARRVGLQPPQVRKHLLELMRLGVPLEAEREPPHVVWSVPLRWFPGGVYIASDDAVEVLRQLARAPANDARDRLLVAIATASRQKPPADVATVTSVQHTEEHLRIVEDAVAQRIALALGYTSARLGVTRDRVLSVQRVLAGPLPRFVAHCHEAGELRMFRVSRIQRARLDPNITYTRVDEAVVDEMVAASVSGYRDPIAPVQVAFTVRAPELRWVVDTTPIPMQAESVAGGLRLSAETAGVMALARFVVGLGAAARAETPELLAAVHELARGALGTNSPPMRSGMPIRSTPWESDNR